MRLTLQALAKLASELPALNFSQLADQKDWLARESVQTYLDFYHINFTKERICQNHFFGKFTSRGYQIATHIWLPENPEGTIFLLHGYTDSVGLMQHAIRFFLQRHWAVVCYDLPGHGLSSGDLANINCFDEYRDTLTACLTLCGELMPAPWRGVGQSTGGAIWMNYLLTCDQQKGFEKIKKNEGIKSIEGANKIEKVLLLAPLVRPTKWQSIRLLLPVYSLFSKQVKRRFKLNSHDLSFVDFVKHKDPLQTTVMPLGWIASMGRWISRFAAMPQCVSPIEVIQGDADDTVDFRFNIPSIRKKFPNNKLVMIEGARHQLLNESEEFRSVLFDKIQQWLN